MIENNNNNPTVAPVTEKTVEASVQPAVQTVAADVPKVEIADKK